MWVGIYYSLGSNLFDWSVGIVRLVGLSMRREILGIIVELSVGIKVG